MKASVISLRVSACITALFVAFMLAFSIKNLHAEDTLKTPLLRSGDYVSVNYLQRLEATKSPLAAEDNNDYNLVEVSAPERDGENDSGAEEKSLEVIPILRFHEGRHEFYQSKNGAVTKIYSTGSDISNIDLIVNAPDRLSLSIANSLPVQYKLMNFDDHLRMIVIAGKYVDQSGENYEFTKSGTAHTPQGDISYIVGADHGLFHFDYIADIKNYAVFKLVRKGCTLDLYTVIDAYKGGYKGGNVSLWHSLRKENCNDAK